MLLQILGQKLGLVYKERLVIYQELLVKLMRLVRALRPSRLATYTLLTAALIYFSLPFYLMVVNGLKPFRDFSSLDIWSVRLSGQSFGTFQAAWSFLSPAFWNSLRVVAPATVVVTLLGALNGYGDIGQGGRKLHLSRLGCSLERAAQAGVLGDQLK